MSITLGVDIGSSACKAVALRDGTEIVAQSLIQVGTGTSGPERVLRDIYAKTGLQQSDFAYTVVTGYGRYSLDIADKAISEISCHSKGVHFLFPTARTILDIGGQDCKAISIDENGAVQCFFMNDKCAAGTGRFIDNMARVLELSVEQMGEYDALSTEKVVVSSTCTVFAESEVISLLSKKKKKEDIIYGIHDSVISRAAGLLNRTHKQPDFVLTGGVAKNAGIRRALEQELKQPVLVAQEPQMTGALGAALYAWKYCEKK